MRAAGVFLESASSVDTLRGALPHERLLVRVAEALHAREDEVARRERVDGDSREGVVVRLVFVNRFPARPQDVPARPERVDLLLAVAVLPGDELLLLAAVLPACHQHLWIILVLLLLEMHPIRNAGG
eukprot:CAMPEP_0170143346 /NCGR_PEP_ID=MMETSP0033_2-20121228/10455_1 /TAXON_ID=195969 /ORGANISM="Dolichomastix tenuilepis, Strain CCMP3274" /LENGTH=126 /DNA_ID=CAMNT_0010379793 /DNA_START=52 /DNA_END=432 /DNA_ORIENTATION=-